MTTLNGHAPPLAPLEPWPPDDPGQSRTAPDSPVRGKTAPDKPGRHRADGTAFIVVALFAVAQVAVVAFSGSWQHQYELSVHLGQAHWVAGMQPLSVEGMIVSASLVIWYAARHDLRKRDAWGAYLVLAAGVGQTVLMNLGADYRWPWLGPEISVWPAVAFVAAYEMAVWLVRKRQDTAAAAVSPVAARVVTGDSGGDKDDTPAVVAAGKIRQRLLDEAEAARLGVSVRTVQRRRSDKAKGSTT